VSVVSSRVSSIAPSLEPSPSPVSDFANLRDPSCGHSPNPQGLSPVEIEVLGQSKRNPPRGRSHDLQGSSPVEVEVLEQSSWGPSCGHSCDLQGLSPVEVEVPEQSSQGPSRGHSPNLQGLLSAEIVVSESGQSVQDLSPSHSCLRYSERSSPVEIDLTGQSKNGLEDDMPSSEGEEDEIDSLLDTGSSELEVHENVHDWREL
jgi:hypothetical protein